MLPWMMFLANLIYKEKKLNEAKNSFERYWINTLDAEDKARLHKYRNTEIQKPAYIPIRYLDTNIKKDERLSYFKSLQRMVKAIWKRKPSTRTVNQWGFYSSEDISNTSDNNIPYDIPKDNILVTSKDDILKENIPDSTKEYILDIPKYIPDIPKDNILDTPKDTISETAKGNIFDIPKDNILDIPKENIIDIPKDDISETAKDIIGIPKDDISETAKDNINDMPKKSETIGVSDGGAKAILNASHDTNQTLAADPIQIGDSTSLYLKHISYLECNFNQFS